MNRALWSGLVGLLTACRGTDPPRVDAPRAGVLDSLLAAGEAVYLRGELESAQVYWVQVQRDAARTGDSLALARSLTWLGLSAWRQGKYGDAERLGRKALALKLRHDLRTDLYKSYNALGLLAWNQGELVEATDLFTKALAAATAVDDRRGEAAASGNLALVATEEGRFRDAREGFEVMLAAGRALRDSRIEGNALTNLGMLDIRVGEPAAAIPRLTAARERYRAIGYATGEQSALGQLGTAYADLGAPGRAIAVLDSALALSRSQGLRQEEASNLEALALIYRSAGDYRRALELYRAARDIDRELELQVELGTNQRSAAEIHAALGAREVARAVAESALVAHREAGARFDELEDRLLLGDLAESAADARHQFEQADRLAHAMAAPQAARAVALARGDAALRQGPADSALPPLRDSTARWAEAPLPVQAERYALLARAFARLAQLDSAAEYGHRAVEILERVRDELRSGSLRTRYLADRAVVYGDLAQVLLAQGRTAEAFMVSDAARSRAVLEHVTDHLAVPAEAPEGPTWFRRVLARLRGVRSDPPAPARPSVAVLEGHPGTEGIQQALAGDELLLEYLPTPDRLLVFGVTRAGVAAATVDITAMALAGRVRVAREVLAAPKDTALTLPVLRGLYRILVGPAEAGGWLRPRQRLLIATHGALTYLPFAALRDPTTGSYLIERHVLQHVPSAATLALLRQRGAASPGTAPVGRAFAPTPSVLRHSVPEVRAIASVTKIESVVGAGASEAAVREALQRQPVVHIAAHADIDRIDALRSGIVVGRGRDEDSVERLEVGEILGLRVRSGLVFLSGCETGLGTAWSTSFEPGEDFATLGQAFLHAGATNVVATLWRVNDAAAAEFAAAYYRALRRDPVGALAAAQRALRHDPGHAHPYYWAGYRLTGAGTPADPSDRKVSALVRP